MANVYTLHVVIDVAILRHFARTLNFGNKSTLIFKDQYTELDIIL